MLNDGSGFKKVYLATGFTNLCRGRISPSVQAE